MALQSPRAPLRGRRIWFAGIGGAGLSSYAVLAAAWGGEVAGWDRVDTPYLRYVRAAGIQVDIAPEPPEPPAGFEVVVSSAFSGRVSGRTRAEFLAELVSLRRSLVVAGAHGKTTTTAMIAFALVELAQDPAFLIGGEVPQLDGNAGTGAGWLVVEGDESDRTIEALRPEIAVVTNVDLDHHSTFRSRAELDDLFERWLAGVPHVVRGEDVRPLDGPLAVAGAHNRRNAACAVAALEVAGVERADAERVVSCFRGVSRRFEAKGDMGGARLFDDYAHHPREVAAALATAREAAGAGRVVVVFQPHLYSRTRHLAAELGASLAAADAVCVTDVYAAREAPVDGVTGKAVVDAVSDARPGMPVGWMPTLEDAAAFVRRRARPGDVVLTAGAGDVDRVGEMLIRG